MKLLVTPARHVGEMLGAHDVDLVLSLISPDAAAPDLSAAGTPSRVLRFNDIAEPREGLIPPSREIVQMILDTARAHRTILIHCFAGVSRSTAAAYVLACQQIGPGHEQDLAARLRAMSPAATPNPAMVAFGDDLLGRGGRMTGAIADIGRGEDAFEGSRFVWNL